MKSKATTVDRTKSRSWTAVVYPDSLPADWKLSLDNYHMQWAISPLHDRDINEATGEIKKPHYHLALYWDSPTTYNNVCAIIQGSCNGTIPQPIASMRGLVRYFCHLDNPEKAQYDMEYIEPHGGFDVAEFLKPTKSQERQMLKDILKYLSDHQIIEYSDCLDHFAETDDDYFDFCVEHTYVIGSYIASLRNNLRYREQHH